MRALMGLIKDRHGTYYAQKRVPDRLQKAVAQLVNRARRWPVFLKNQKGAEGAQRPGETRAIGPLLRDAEALIKLPQAPVTVRTTLNDAVIKRMAEYVCAKARVKPLRPNPTGLPLV